MRAPPVNVTHHFIGCYVYTSDMLECNENVAMMISNLMRTVRFWNKPSSGTLNIERLENQMI